MLNKDMMVYREDTPNLMDWYDRQVRMVAASEDGSAQAMAPIGMDQILKAAITSGDTGAYNATYTRGVVAQVATQASVFGAIPKKAWTKQGWRAVSAASKSSGVGIAEGGALGTAVEPTFVEIAPTIKEWELVSEFSTRMDSYSRITDALDSKSLNTQIEKDFFKSLNADMLVDMDTLASNNVESIDRICGSSGENTGLGYTAADEDLYSVDRSANTWFNGNSLHASGVDRTLSESLINDLREGQEKYWETFPENKMYITGFDSWTAWSELEAAKLRFGMDNFTMTVGEGIKTSPGGKSGWKISTWDGVPIIRSDNVAQDTISRIYLLDTDHVELANAIPISFHDNSDMWVVGHTIKGAWYGAGELICDRPQTCGKLRDLK
jgi:hypothetical protein